MQNQILSSPAPSIITEDLYAFDHASPLTQRYFSSRTAAANAAFFLPFLQSGMSLLDCGCGSGSITLGLAEAVAPSQVVGIDIAPSEIDAARQRAAKSKYSTVRFETANIYELPFVDKSFDVVFTHNMPEHLSDPVAAFKEMHRVLKPGGLIGVRDLDAGGLLLSGPSEDVVRESLVVWIEDCKQVGGDPYIGRRLRALLREAGFVRIEATASYDTFPNPEALRRLTEVMAARYKEEVFIERTIKHGLVDREQMGTYANAWREFGNHPDDFFANAHGEAVGWKA